MLTLYRTFLQVVFLRKGPEHIPHSEVLLVVVSGAWLVVEFVGTLAVNSQPLRSILIDMILLAVSFVIYIFVVAMFRKRDRILRMLTTMIGVSALFGIAMFCCLLLLPKFLIADSVNWIIVIVALWSVAVEAHIIARTIEETWPVGLLIAFAVFVLQLQLSWALGPIINPGT